MTTSQNTPAPQQGRHRVASHYDQPGQYVGTGHPHGGRPQPGYGQPSGPVPGYAPPPQQIPGQWAPVRQSAPAQHHPNPPHPSQGHPAPAQRYPAAPAQAYPVAPAAPAQPYPAAPATPAQSVPVQVAQAPRNGLGIAALCLGIVGMLFGLIPFTGFIAFGLGAIGVVLGLVGFARSRKRIATNTKTALAGTILSTIAVALGVWGMVIVFTGLNQLSEDLSQIPAPSTVGVPSGTTLPADVTSPATTGPATYQLEVTGTADKMMVAYGTGAATSATSNYQSLPWRKTVEATGDYPFANVTATSSGPGSITCTITDTASGAVVATQTSTSLDDSQYSSATVSCNTTG